MSARHLVALLTLATLAAAPARGQILYSYGGPPGDGPVGPSGNLIEGANGVLYGTAYGMPNDLTLPSAYSLTPTPGASTYTVSILHTGDELGGRLLLAPAGGLYGFGHSATGAYFYILTPPPPSQTDWTESILFNLPATNGIPTTGPIAGPGGSIFGQDNMSVFQLVPPVAGATAWTQQPVYTLPANALFEAGFLYAPTGVLYGALPFSGASGQGQIIALTPPTPGNATWTESVLYDFTSGKDGFAPSGGIALDASGALYGVSRGGKGAGCKGGCGTVFRLAPPAQQGAAWKYTLLHTFTGADGSDPFGVTLDRQGNLYGNTYQGGIASPGPCSAGCGTIFKLTKPAPGQTTWVETVAVIPSGRYGAGPLIPFIGTDNRLYDIASAGGEFDRGEAFALPENFK